MHDNPGGPLDPTAILDLIPDPVCVIEPTGAILWKSRPARELLGSRRSLMDNSVVSEVSAFRTLISEALQYGSAESRIAVHDTRGRLRLLQWRATLMPDVPGGVTRLHCIGRDLSNEVHLQYRLDTSHRRYQLITESSTDVLVRSMLDGTILWASPAFARETGLHPDAIVGFKIWDLTTGLDEHVRTLQDVSAGAELASVEILIKTTFGRGIWMAIRSGPFVEADGTVSGSVLNLRNVDGEVAIRKALQASEERFRRLIHDAPIGTAVADPSGRLVLANPALCELLGRAPDGLQLLRWDDILAPGDLAAVRAHVPFIAPGHTPVYRADVRCIRGDGSMVRAALSVSSLRGPDQQLQGFIAQITDQSALHGAIELLRFRADHDALTGLDNRDSALRFIRGIASDSDSALQVGILFCDLDDFKCVNDRYGHPVGDRVLQEFAARLAAVVGSNGCTARLGGDEFLVVIPVGTQVSDIADLADSVLTCLDEPFALDDGPHRLTASVGITVDSPERDAEHLLREADDAMYLVKQCGGNGWASCHRLVEEARAAAPPSQFRLASAR